MRTRYLVAIAALFSTLFGCTENPPSRCGVDCATSSTSPQNYEARGNLLNLAAPASARLETPWDAQDEALLRIAKSRTPGSDIVVGAIFETVTPCAGGGTQTDIQDNVPPPWYSQGDSYTTVFAACVNGNTQTDGQRAFSVDALVGQPYIDTSWTTGTTISRDLTRTDMTTGQVNFAIGSATEVLEVVNNSQYTQTFAGNSNRNWFNNGTEQVGTEQYQVDYAWDETTQLFQWDFNVSSTHTIFGDSAAVTLQTLTGTLGQPPESGQFQSTKTSEGVTTISTITATGGGTVLIETDSDGDGIIDTTTNSTWDQLLLDPMLNQFI